VIRTLASIENPLFSQPSMSAAAAASSSRCMWNHRITRRRTRSEVGQRIDPAGQGTDHKAPDEQEHDRREVGSPGCPLGEDAARGDGGEFESDVMHEQLPGRPGRLFTAHEPPRWRSKRQLPAAFSCSFDR
jgi:hypothetical protein